MCIELSRDSAPKSYRGLYFCFYLQRQFYSRSNKTPTKYILYTLKKLTKKKTIECVTIASNNVDCYLSIVKIVKRKCIVIRNNHSQNTQPPHTVKNVERDIHCEISMEQLTCNLLCVHFCFQSYMINMTLSHVKESKRNVTHCIAFWTKPTPAVILIHEFQENQVFS